MIRRFEGGRSTQKLFGLVRFFERRAQPVGGRDKSVDVVRVQIRRKLEPRQNFPHGARVLLAIGSAFIPVSYTHLDVYKRQSLL